MTTFQTLTMMIAFASLIVSIISLAQKKQSTREPISREWITVSL